MAPKQNKKGPGLIPRPVAKSESTPKYLNKNVAVMQGWMRDGNEANIFLSLRFIQEKFQCFSDWSKTEMAIFWDFNRKIHNMSWELLYSQASKGKEKRGYAPTIINKSKYSNQDFIKELDPGLDLFELRLNDKIRVHGFRDKAIFYLCFLDKNHEIGS